MEAEEKKEEAAENGGADASPSAPGDAPEKESKAAAEEGEKAEGPKPAKPDWRDMYARLLADFDNFKKRTARDREDTYRFAEADILGDMLPAVDNLALALDKAENKKDAFVRGVQLVYDAILKSLKNHGAEPFDSIGKELDTERMNAISTMPSEEVEEGKVLFESKRGWMLRGKVLRVADVVVSAGKASNG